MLSLLSDKSRSVKSEITPNNKFYLHWILEIFSCNLPSHLQSMWLPIWAIKTPYWPGSNTTSDQNRKKCLKLSKRPSSKYCNRPKMRYKAGGYFSPLPLCICRSLIISRQVFLLPTSKLWPENWWHLVINEYFKFHIIASNHLFSVTTD